VTRLVKDSCVQCENLWKTVEFGSCNCESDYSKGLSDAEISWLKRHGRLSDIKKPSYAIEGIQKPLENVMNAMQKLSDESARLNGITKGINELSQKRMRKSRRKNAKITIQITVNDLEKSKADVEHYRKDSLKKNDDFVILGVLDGSVKGLDIQNWIEKRLEAAR
jgi:hypothetical protein